MKKYFYILLFLFLSPLLVNAKSAEISPFSYGGAYNDNFNSVEATSDGGYIAVGKTNSKKIGDISTGDGNALIVKFDKDNNIEWQKFYGGKGSEEFYDVLVDKDENYVVVGYTLSTDIEGQTNLGASDGLIVKLDKDGNVLWNTLIGGTDDDYIHAVEQLSNGQYIVVGRSDSPEVDDVSNNGSLDGFIGTISNDGRLIAKRLYGGSSDEAFYAIEIKDDYIYVVGYSKSDIGEYKNKGMQDCLFVKFNDDLDVEWEKYFGDTKSDMLRAIKNTLDGGFIVTGFTYINTPIENGNIVGSSGLTIKYDKNGNEEWSRIYGGNSSDSFEKVEQMNNGDYVVVGKGFSNNIDGMQANGKQAAYIVIYNNDGELIWNKAIGGTENDIITDVTILDNKKFIAVGQAYSTNIEGVYNNGASDALVVNGKMHYVITKLPAENGTFDAVDENDIGKIEVNPDEGYKLDKITIKDTSDKIVPFTEDNGKYYFELYDDVTVEVLFRKDEIENPETGDNIVMFLYSVVGLCLMILLCIMYFGKRIKSLE